MKNFKGVKWGIGFILALVAFISLQGPETFASTATLVQLSSDPFTNITGQHQTEVEPDTFAFGSTIVSAFQVGRFFDGGSSDIGWATSLDEGKTWKHDFLPGITKIVNPANPFDRVSDASVAYDAKHKVWLISSLAVTGKTGATVIVNRSTDGGLTWGDPIVVHQGTGTDFLDKDWIVCDNTATSPFYGHCYIEWDNTGRHNLFQMSTSSDGALTWSTPNTSPDHASVLGGQPLVQPNGTVIVPIQASTNNATELGDFISADGGITWSNTITIASLSVFAEPAQIRSGAGIPSAEIDGSGNVYVVWQDCRFEPNCTANDLVMSTSTNGITWSPVQRIPTDPMGSGIDHIIPGLAVDSSTSGTQAHLGLAYYFLPNAKCSTNTCQLMVGFISSTDGGRSWSPASTLTSPMMLTWFAQTNQGYMAGDYISTSIAPGSDNAVPVFAVAHAPTATQLDETMNTALVSVNSGSAADTVRASSPDIQSGKRG